MESTSLAPAVTFNFLPSLGDGVTLVFYLIAAIYVVFTAVFYYHWQQYGTNAKVTWITYIVYFATTIPPMIVLGLITLSL